MSFDKNNKTHLIIAGSIVATATATTIIAIKKKIKKKKELELFKKNKEELEEILEILSELSYEMIQLAEEQDQESLVFKIPHSSKTFR